MESTIAKAIGLKYQPVALLWSNEKPEGAMQFSEGKWGCVMWLAVPRPKASPPWLIRKPSAVSVAAWGWVSAISI